MSDFKGDMKPSEAFIAFWMQEFWANDGRYFTGACIGEQLDGKKYLDLVNLFHFLQRSSLGVRREGE